MMAKIGGDYTEIRNEDENFNLNHRENVFTVLAPTDEAFAGIWI